ncbi:MAG: efflux RND transporter permease subunit [Devosiaceae bacterium]|nr:efflux RND transporter permease subunit [Devosiaceae bacterium MH13]
MNGALKWMAEHPVAGNMVMIIVLIAGIASALSIRQTTFPEFDLDTVSIEVNYQGASPREVSQSIVRPIEDQLASIDGIDEINATASEGRASVTVSFLGGEDVIEKLDEIKTEVDRISVFPEDAEEPTVTRSSNNTRVLEIAVHGSASQTALVEAAERLKDELTLLDAVSFVETQNIPDREIAITFDRDTLAAYQLSLDDVARVVGANSLELPGGDVDSQSVSVPIRTIGRNFTGDEFGDIVIRTGENGAQVLLSDIATITDGFEDNDLQQRFAGDRSVTVNVFRVGDEQVLDVAAAARGYIEGEFRGSLPAGVSVTIWQDESIVLQSRLDLLIKNAFTGLFLVVICLALFLDVRLAFWCAMNIGIAFAGTFVIMSILDVSVNMISLFGFILAIGIVVDNAIVISENIFKNGEKGEAPKNAAVIGVQRVAVPVIFSALTTIVAFTPLMQMPAPLGSFLVDIPIIVMIVLTLSLLQSLFVLPNNLSGMRVDAGYRAPLAFRPLGWIRNMLDAMLQWFIEKPLNAVLGFVTRRFIVPIAGVVAAMIMTVGLVAHGYVKFEFFPSIDGEYVIANLDLVDGTSLERTEDVADTIRLAAERAALALAEREGMSEPIIVGVNTVVGRSAAGGGPFGGAPSNNSSLANITVQILPPEDRSWPTSTFESAWIAEIGSVAGLSSLTVSSSLVDAGSAVALELSVPDGLDVAPVVDDVRAQLRAIPGVFGIEDDASAGRPEFILALRDEARLYGVTLNDLATQIRAGFFGVEATRVQRGSDDVQVSVRYAQDDRQGLVDILDTDIRTPSGELIPLSVVAELDEGLAATEVIRRNGRTITTITADVDVSVITAQEANGIIRSELLPVLAERYPGLIVEFGGEQRTQGEAQAALGQATILALLVIFALLALIFRSYIQPIVVMIAIPLGLIGAILGHYIVGVSLGLLSIFGIIGLAGVVINNSLVMIDLYNEYLEKGMDTRAAVIKGTKDRFRPILLTSITTFLGIYPLIMETSLQAQFLIPLAVSVGFGVLFGTVIIVLAVPAFFVAQSRLFFTFKKPEAPAQKVEEPKARQAPTAAANDDEGLDVGLATAAE